jgi:hypothetical protein
MWFTMLLDVIEFKILDDYEVIITFENNETRKISLKHLLNEKPFNAFKDKILFECAFVKNGTLCWPGDIDIAPEYLYEHSVRVEVAS